MVKFKKIVVFLLSLIICLFAVYDAHAGNTCHWYFKSASDGKQPSLMGESGINNHPSVLSIGSPDEKKVYFTFDAGYSTKNVEKTLDVLKEENVPAAFFILPAVYKNTPDVAKRMHNEGHLVCNHTYTHTDVSNLSLQELERELLKLETEYEEYTGNKMAKYFRPPEGAFSINTPDYCAELGYKCVFWSFAYADWDNNAQKSPQWAKNKILSNMHNGCVLLLHPNSETNAKILKDVIKELKARGYSFGTLDELASLRSQ